MVGQESVYEKRISLCVLTRLLLIILACRETGLCLLLLLFCGLHHLSMAMKIIPRGGDKVFLFPSTVVLGYRSRQCSQKNHCYPWSRRKFMEKWWWWAGHLRTWVGVAWHPKPQTWFPAFYKMAFFPLCPSQPKASFAFLVPLFISNCSLSPQKSHQYFCLPLSPLTFREPPNASIFHPFLFLDTQKHGSCFGFNGSHHRGLANWFLASAPRAHLEMDTCLGSEIPLNIFKLPASHLDMEGEEDGELMAWIIKGGWRDQHSLQLNETRCRELGHIKGRRMLPSLASTLSCFSGVSSNPLLALQCFGCVHTL